MLLNLWDGEFTFVINGVEQSKWWTSNKEDLLANEFFFTI
jgi:hypothetical protein